MTVTWISVKMSYYWQINWEVQKIKWTICKRIGFSPLHSIVQPVILFLSEWTGKMIPTTSTSDALIVIIKGALGRVLFVVKIYSDHVWCWCFLMSQSQDWNSSFWQEYRDAHICAHCLFLCGLFSHPSATHPWSVLDGCRWLLQDKRREKDYLSNNIVVPRDI